jgi:arylsulfatase A-like enzyme
MGDRRPNILLIIADQLRLDACGFAGRGRASTPNIDALAREGCWYRQAVSSHPVCGPCRASLFTGCHASTTGYVINELSCRTDLPTLAGCLGQEGYRRAYFGKWHLWAAEAKDDPVAFHRNPANQFVPPGPDRLGFDDHWEAYNFNHDYWHGFIHGNGPERIRLPGYEPDALTDRAISYLQSGQAEPFIACVSFGPPHQPWDAGAVPPCWLENLPSEGYEHPPNYAEGSAEYWHAWYDRAWWRREVAPRLPAWRRIYAAMVANIDWNVGRLLTALAGLGLDKDTLVVFTSDHGEMFGAHGRVQKNIFYEEAARIPLLMRWPGRIAAGAVSDACIASPDLMPTILGFARTPIPASVEGMDLSHCALGLPGPVPRDALLQGMGPSVDWQDGHEWRALRDPRHTYAVHRHDRREELYDNTADPLQLRNLVEDVSSRPLLDNMRRRLSLRMQQIHDDFAPITWYRDHWTSRGRILRGARDGDAAWPTFLR